MMDSRINIKWGQNFQDMFSLTTHATESVLPEDLLCATPYFIHKNPVAVEF